MPPVPPSVTPAALSCSTPACPASEHIVTATLIGATVVGTLGFLLARRYKMPTIVFTVSGVIPMFPGILAYRAMLEILQISGVINIGRRRPA